MTKIDMTSLSEIEAVIDEIRVDFHSKLENYHARLSEILDADAWVNEIDAAIFIAHRIGGVAGTFGYAELGRTARIAEGALSSVQGGAGADHATALAHIEALSFEIAGICFGATPATRHAGTV